MLPRTIYITIGMNHFCRVVFQPSGDRIVLPSGLLHKTQSAVILRLRQDEAASVRPRLRAVKGEAMWTRLRRCLRDILRGLFDGW